MYGGTEVDRALYALNTRQIVWWKDGDLQGGEAKLIRGILVPCYVTLQATRDKDNRHVSALVDHYHNKEPINFLRNYRNKQIKGRKRVTFIEANSNTMK